MNDGMGVGALAMRENSYELKGTEICGEPCLEAYRRSLENLNIVHKKIWIKLAVIGLRFGNGAITKEIPAQKSKVNCKSNGYSLSEQMTSLFS